MNADLGELALHQHGVMRRGQLRDMGVTPDFVRAQVRARRWTLLGDTVVLLHNGPLALDQQRWAAKLAGGESCALGGLTSLELGGLRGWEDNAIHVLTPRGRSPLTLEGINIVTHETRVLTAGELDKIHSPARTRVERSAIDAAIWSASERRGCGILAAVVQQRLSTGPRLLSALNAAGRVRHRRVLRLVLNDISGGAEALSEIDFARFCRRNNLGKLVHQAIRLDGLGNRRYVDAFLESPDGERLGCEVDGAVHLLERTYWDDMFRANELLISGVPLLRFPSVAFHLDEARVADQIRRAYKTVGRLAA